MAYLLLDSSVSVLINKIFEYCHYQVKDMMRIIERRKRKPLTQPDFTMYLNVAQMKTYIRLKEIGWKMYFIRRPVSGSPTVVMNNNVDTRIGVIEQNGNFTVNPNLISTRPTLRDLLSVRDGETA